MSLAELRQANVDPVEDLGGLVCRIPAWCSLMDGERARELLATERRRLEHALARHMHEGDGEQSDPFFDPGNLAAKLYQDELEETLAEDLRVQLAALERAEQRLAAGTCGLPIDSGKPIPDERLAALPIAELTTEEERDAARGGG